MHKTVIQHIASIMTARNNCHKAMEQPLGGHAERMYRLHGSALSTLLSECLPRGSGIGGVELNYELTDVDAERFVFDVPFHVMNENGFYVGWAHYRVTVTSSFVLGMNVEIEQTESTDDDAEYDLDGYICETMKHYLSHPFDIPAVWYAGDI